MKSKSLPLSSGKTPSVTRVTRKLTEEQIKLVEDNYSEVFKKLSDTIKKSKFFINNPDRKVGKSLAEQAIGFLPQVALEFKPERTKQSFAVFATHRCILRLSAEFFRNNPYYRSAWYLKNREAKEDSPPEKQFHVINMTDIGDECGRRAKMVTVKQSNAFEQQDLFEAIKRKSMSYFSDSDKSIKILINEHLLPKCCGESYKSLDDIALELNVKRPTLYQMLKGDKIKKFFNTIYAENLT